MLTSLNNIKTSKIMKTKKMATKLQQTYTKYTHVEHVLKLPDTYVGSVEHHEEMINVVDQENNIQSTKIRYVPALYKIFDEILVNAVDQHTRCETTKGVKQVTEMSVNISQENGTIEVINNGEGIDIMMMKEHQMYPPELIFGCLLTSSNYDEKEQKVTGGKNGYGAKLANIFSTEFIVETVDHNRKKKYLQTFNDNMSKKTKPIITPYTDEPFTRIQFSPDFKRLGMTYLEDDAFQLMKKRVFDVAAWVGKRVDVMFNGEKITQNNLLDYSNL